MTLTRKDLAATALTALVLLVFAATHERWSVPLVGDSYRWATGAVIFLGACAWALGSPTRSRGDNLFAVLGASAGGLTAVSLYLGSLTPLSLLVADLVVIWAAATVRHALRRAPHVSEIEVPGRVET